MPTNTYVALDKVTVSSAVASVTFSSINQGYTDLVLVSSMQTSINNDAARLQFNSDSSTNYSFTQLYGNGSSATSNRATNQTAGRFANDCPNSSYFGVYVTQIQNYSNATTFKTILSRGNAANQSVQAFATLWRKTPEAITSITIAPESGGTLLSGSTFSLYGIAASSVGAKATGGIISSDSQYYYHTFLSSSTFTPLQSLTADVLVIAGGGGGGGDIPGGAGAGGIIYSASRSLTTTPYTCTVGAGGARGVQGGTDPGTDGVDSYFDVLRAFGGARGTLFANGANGGSGSGGAYGTFTGGTSTQTSNNGGIGYGNSGGNSTSANFASAGGGGAGGAGGANASTVGGAGGAGLNTWSSWASATGTGVSGFFAGGGGGGGSGGGGAAGSGGGGAGAGRSTGSPAGSGVINTGGGGGSAAGGNPIGTGGTGGSGVVIVRYAKV